MISLNSAIRQGLRTCRRLGEIIEQHEIVRGEYAAPMREELAAWRRLLFHAGLEKNAIPAQPPTNADQFARWKAVRFGQHADYCVDGREVTKTPHPKVQLTRIEQEP